MNRENCIIVDLDDTMLDTKKMYDELIGKELSRFGITSEIFWATNDKEFENRSGLGMYSLDDHLDILGGEVGMDKGGLGKIKSLIISFVACNSGNYIFSDVMDFLDSYHRQAHITLLTRGPENLQSLKIAGLSKCFDLKRFFKDIVITSKNKGYLMNELCDDNNRLNVFIDDSLTQINSVIKARPDIVTMLIKRAGRRTKRGRLLEYEVADPDYDISNLEEADEILCEII